MRSSPNNADLTVWVVLALTVVALYGQVVGFDFCYYDDNYYVLQNPWVNSGLTPANVAWAFTTNAMCHWHPVTWLSYFIDTEIARLSLLVFGIGFGHGNAGLYHLTNVLLHAANAVLLFVLLNSLTGCRRRSAFVAMVFAIHPLNVEPVAWIAQRKDVLSTIFWFLTTLLYAKWVKTGERRLRVIMVPVFALGLMSKSMLVTLPIVLLLLDVWPLGRFGPVAMEAGVRTALRRLAAEKWPLFALAAGSSVVAIWAPKAAGVVQTMQQFPLWARILNALQSVVIYIYKAFVPINLSVIYPHPGTAVSVSAGVVAGCCLILITVAALRLGKSLPYVQVGWLWYLITLIPVSGLIQVGDEARADRYTYVPMIGIYLLITWAASDTAAFIIRSARVRAVALSSAAAVVILALATVTYSQIGVWENSESLFGHAIRVIPRNADAHNGLGSAMMRKGDFESARDQFRAALAIDPSCLGARFNYATALMKLGDLESAERELRDLLKDDPDPTYVHATLGEIHLARNDYDKAITEFKQALRLAPKDAVIHNGLGTAYARSGRIKEAIREFEQAVRLNPKLSVAQENLQNAREITGEE